MSQAFKAGFNVPNDFTAEGWLLKEGHGWGGGAWPERYFVLNTKTRTISYYDDSDKKSIHKKGEYSFRNPKCRVEANNTKSGHPHCIFALGSSENKDDELTDLWIDAVDPIVQRKWISAIQKAIRGEPLVESARQEIQQMQKTIEETRAELRSLESIPYPNEAQKKKIWALKEELGIEEAELAAEMALCDPLSMCGGDSCDACVIA